MSEEQPIEALNAKQQDRFSRQNAALGKNNIVIHSM